MARGAGMTSSLDTLRCADLEISARLPRASNATFLAAAIGPGVSQTVVYKPSRGERPLWDFPRGSLGRREVATFLVSDALGWDLVPPTVLRQGPLGPGSVQLFVEAGATVEDVLCLVEQAHDILQPLAVLDVIVNSADRKVGHCLLDTSGHLWAVDNGLTFHAEPKLRTVLWAWAGEEIPPDLMSDVRRLRRTIRGGSGPIARELGRLLSGADLSALVARFDRLSTTPIFPEPDEYGPALPWPPY